jgi:hypothetical protein
MTGFREAFALHKDEVRLARPLGTIHLSGPSIVLLLMLLLLLLLLLFSIPWSSAVLKYHFNHLFEQNTSDHSRMGASCCTPSPLLISWTL